MGVLLALLGWQVAVAAAASLEELGAHPLAARMDALALDADARRRADLGEHEALYQALTRHMAADDPKLVLWFPPARPGRLFEPEMLVLADHLRALLFPAFVRSYSASRPVPRGFESGLDPTFYVVDLTAGASVRWGVQFQPLQAGNGWTLLRFRGEP